MKYERFLDAVFRWKLRCKAGSLSSSMAKQLVCLLQSVHSLADYLKHKCPATAEHLRKMGGNSIMAKAIA
jgi:hypothetical protein